MENNNQIKISLKATITIIIITIMIILIALILIFNKNKNQVSHSNYNHRDYDYNIPDENISDITENNNNPNIEYLNSNNDFDINFLKLESNKQNLIYSPLSIKYGLNLLNDGANGNTKKEIETVIKDLSLTKYDNIDNVLSLANCIYMKDDFTDSILDSYKNSIKQKYNAEINFDSFKDAQNINNWIKEKTLGQIPNILNDKIVQNPNLKLLLINSLAINMEWESPFESTETNGKPFYLENGNEIIATTMNKDYYSFNKTCSYYLDSNLTAVSLKLKKYNNNEFEFIAIMPNSDLTNYIKNLNIDDINTISSKCVPVSETENGINISIPRFSFEYDLALKNDLKNIGINEAFSDSADLSNITGDNNLFVGDALHKSNIDFSEEGVKASASTVMSILEKSAEFEDENKLIEININRPFLFLIKDKLTNEIWFVGTVFEPNLWSKDKSEYKY